MAKPKKSKPAKPSPKSLSPAAADSSSPMDKQEGPTNKHEEEQPAQKETFESYYLKRVTAEFADDIDKIRNASDFTERSVPVLIHALKQGAGSFSEEEKERIMSARR